MMKYTQEQINEALQIHLFLPATEPFEENPQATERLNAIAERMLDKSLNFAQAWKELRKEGWRANKGRPA